MLPGLSTFAPMQIRSFQRQLTSMLTSWHGPQEAEAIVLLLLEHLTGWSRARLRSLNEETFSPDQAEQAKVAAQRLKSGEPIQHITGIGHFYGRDFRVSPAVLIPRPETEELVAWARDTWREQFWPTHHGKLLDVGSGSGCIAISLALELADRGIEVLSEGIDLSPEAIALAHENAMRLRANTRFSQLDILQAHPRQYQALQLLISNPPYIPERERIDLHPQVREYEPDLALFVPNQDPLRFYRKIAELGCHWLKPGGMLFFETHRDYGVAVANLLRELGYREVVLRQDMARRDRMVRGVN
jgi:release factor glutamine methyltransferase